MLLQAAGGVQGAMCWLPNKHPFRRSTQLIRGTVARNSPSAPPLLRIDTPTPAGMAVAAPARGQHALVTKPHGTPLLTNTMTCNAQATP